MLIHSELWRDEIVVAFVFTFAVLFFLLFLVATPAGSDSGLASKTFVQLAYKLFTFFSAEVPMLPNASSSVFKIPTVLEPPSISSKQGRLSMQVIYKSSRHLLRRTGRYFVPLQTSAC